MYSGVDFILVISNLSSVSVEIASVDDLDEPFSNLEVAPVCPVAIVLAPVMPALFGTPDVPIVAAPALFNLPVLTIGIFRLALIVPGTLPTFAVLPGFLVVTGMSNIFLYCTP